MNKMPVLIAAALVTIAVALYHFGTLFSEWKDPISVSDLVTSDFAYYLSAGLTEEGIFYPANDLDDPLLDSRKIVISHAMNQHTVKDVVRKLLYLNALNENEPIDLYISTQGGWYDSAFTIIDTFHVITAPVNTVCIGGCYSAGLVLLAAGTGDRIAYPNTLLSVHISYGTTEDTRAYAELPDRVNGYLQRITELPDEWFPLEDDRDYFLTPEQALDFGVIDHVKTERHKSKQTDNLDAATTAAF